MKLVLKFGGTSLASPKDIIGVAKTVVSFSKDNEIVVVCSAVDGTTDDLILISKMIEQRKKDDVNELLDKLTHVLNKTKNIKNSILKAKSISISALEMQAITKDNIKKYAIAINEISLLRQSKQTASLQIKKGKKTVIKKLISDGVLVSTPAGSTAYNLSVHGPILSLNSKKLAITPISPFRPRRWKGSVVSDKSTIRITNLDTKKRPVSVVADNVEFRNIKNVKIFVNRKIKFNLLYDSKSSLNKKIKIEQVRREIN